MFSLNTAIDITFKIEIIIHVKDIISEGFVAPFFINQKMPIYALRDHLQKFINKSYVNIVQQHEHEGKKMLPKN